MAEISLSDILQLSVSERLQIMTAIWDSLAAEPERLALSEERQEEILRRSAAYKSQPEQAIPLDEALTRLYRSAPILRD